MKLFERSRCIVVVGETGSGKTTQLPQFALEALQRLTQAEGGSEGPLPRVVCTQPRRVAAISVASRVADELDVALGDAVGYSIRFESRASERTRLKYLTDGMLLREAMADPALSQYQCVILDEAHERTVGTDVLFGLVKRLLQQRRDLRVVVMSATLDHRRFQDFFGGDDAPLFRIEGRSFQVELNYARQPLRDYLEAAARTAVQLHVVEPPGDVLIFLTGAEEIHECCAQIQRSLDLLLEDPARAPLVGPVRLVPLYSTLTPQQQQEIFCAAPGPREGSCAPGRKIVVATNIAETSLTIDGIVYVIDCGFCKEKVYNPRVRVESLVVSPISQAAAKQRAGRAGRTREGKCYRLYTENHFRTQLAAQGHPEILRSNLCAVVLLLKRLGVRDIVRFDFLDPPVLQAVVRALEELHYLGALDDDGNLTALGASVAEFPLEPQLARMLLAAPGFRCTEQALSIAAMLSAPPVFLRPGGGEGADEAARAHQRFRHASGDHFTLLAVLDAYLRQPQREREAWCRRHYFNPRFLASAADIRAQLGDILARVAPLPAARLPNLAPRDAEFVPSVQRCLVAGFFMQVAYLQRSGIFITVKDLQPVALHPTSFMKGRTDAPWVIFSEFVLTTQNYIRTCSPVAPELLFEMAPHYYQVSSFTSPEVQRGLQRALDDVKFRNTLALKKRANPSSDQIAKDILSSSTSIDKSLSLSKDNSSSSSSKDKSSSSSKDKSSSSSKDKSSIGKSNDKKKSKKASKKSSSSSKKSSKKSRHE